MAQRKNYCHCSVPFCESDKRRHSYLSFHGIPSEETLRKERVQAIKRDERLHSEVVALSLVTLPSLFHLSTRRVLLADNTQQELHKTPETWCRALTFWMEQLWDAIKGVSYTEGHLKDWDLTCAEPGGFIVGGCCFTRPSVCPNSHTA